MSDPTPNPAHDDNGVPLCNQAGCGLFDGKRCKATGFRPDRFCEPALVEIVAENKALKATVASIEAAADEIRRGPRIGRDGFSAISCDRERTGEYPCPGCGAAAGAPCSRSTAVTLDAPPPEDLLDRITPGSLCRHTRRSLRPDPHGNPVTTCIDCGDETP